MPVKILIQRGWIFIIFAELFCFWCIRTQFPILYVHTATFSRHNYSFRAVLPHPAIYITNLLCLLFWWRICIVQIVFLWLTHNLCWRLNINSIPRHLKGFDYSLLLQTLLKPSKNKIVCKNLCQNCIYECHRWLISYLLLG
jgi:hypothetical protein